MTVCVVVSSVCESISSPVAETPSQLHSADIRMIASAKIPNSVIGCGSLLPTRSIPLSILLKTEGFLFFVFSGDIIHLFVFKGLIRLFFPLLIVAGFLEKNRKN